jgi:hypothetical protein
VKKKHLLPFAALFLLFAHPGHAARVRDAKIEALSNRLFPLLTAWHAPAEGKIADMLTERRRRMAACGDVPSCLLPASLWSGPERDLLAGMEREIDGLNHIIEVYGLGEAPRYPEIDGPNFASKPRFLADAITLAKVAEGDELDPSITLALALLDAGGRDDAAAFEPLDGSYNAPAMARARMLDWSRYAYTAIIVPGIGPDDLATPLSAKGKLNVHMAAQHFFDGVAPFIIVSGGMVHPRGTSHAEALEMRQALIERFGVPADCIVLEPYARHTTTNLRNASRRLAALGAPDRDALIVTYAEQSKMIESPAFAARNRLELGYEPGIVGTRLSPNELTFRPAKESLRIDPMDPLDP